MRNGLDPHFHAARRDVRLVPFKTTWFSPRFVFGVFGGGLVGRKFFGEPTMTEPPRVASLRTPRTSLQASSKSRICSVPNLRQLEDGRFAPSRIGRIPRSSGGIPPPKVTVAINELLLVQVSPAPFGEWS